MAEQGSRVVRPRFSDVVEQSQVLFAQHAVQTDITETTPPEITAHIREFAAQLGPEPPQYVPVANDSYGLYGWCSDGVSEKIRHDGGGIRFGWTIWEWPYVMLTSEFHAVWLSADSGLLDITPKPMGETRILFVPDPTYPADFDFDNRPLNRRSRLYAPDESAITAEIAGQIATMKPAQLAYETRRATRAGVSLERWLLRKKPVDPLPALIDGFIDLTGLSERLFTPTKGQAVCTDPERYVQIEARRSEVIRSIRSEVKARRLGS